MFLPEGVAEGAVQGLEAYRENESRQASMDYNKRILAMQEGKRAEESQGAEAGGESLLAYLSQGGTSSFVAPPNAPDGSSAPPPPIQPAMPQPGAQAMAPGQSSVAPPQTAGPPQAAQPPAKMPGQSEQPGMDVLSYAKWFKSTYPQASGKDFMYGLNAMMPVFDQRSKMIAEMIKIKSESNQEAKIAASEKMAALKMAYQEERDEKKDAHTAFQEKMQLATQLRMAQSAERADRGLELRERSEQRKSQESEQMKLSPGELKEFVSMWADGGDISEMIRSRGKDATTVMNQVHNAYLAEAEAKNMSPEEAAERRLEASRSRKSDQIQLQTAEKNLTTIRPYVSALDVQIKKGKELIDKVQNTDAKLANKPLNWWKDQATAGGEYGELAAQILTLQTDISRITRSGSTLGGVLSDNAVKLEHEVLNMDQPLSRMKKVLDLVLWDSKVREGELKEEVKLRRKGSVTPWKDYKPGEPEEPKSDYGMKPGGIPTVKSDEDFKQLPSGSEFIDPNGVKRRKP